MFRVIDKALETRIAESTAFVLPIWMARRHSIPDVFPSHLASPPTILLTVMVRAKPESLDAFAAPAARAYLTARSSMGGFRRHLEPPGVEFDHRFGD
jgi:hypothetical protein